MLNSLLHHLPHLKFPNMAIWISLPFQINFWCWEVSFCLIRSVAGEWLAIVVLQTLVSHSQNVKLVKVTVPGNDWFLHFCNNFIVNHETKTNNSNEITDLKTNFFKIIALSHCFCLFDKSCLDKHIMDIIGRNKIIILNIPQESNQEVLTSNTVLKVWI